MYGNRMTPVQRMRKGGGVGPRHSATQGVSTFPKRNSLDCSSVLPKRTNGDYQVLKTNVEKERNAVQEARVALASSLDQLGEHHVRQQEYDDAMDAFTEALREKKSAYSNTSEPMKGIESESIFSGLSSDGQEEQSQRHDDAIDEIVNTLRNIGNVHSLRGEQDEAMRYFTEVTSLRAQKMSTIHTDPSSCISGQGESRSMLSAINDDNSTLMSEINEDVKALDDLFRSISFRSQPNGLSQGSQKSVVSGGTEKRKSKSANESCQRGCQNDEQQQYKRRKSNANGSDNQGSNSGESTPNRTTIVENEPFKRTPSSLSLQKSGSEVSEALEVYRRVLSHNYHGRSEERHRELINSLSLRAELLSEQKKQKVDNLASPSSTQSSEKKDEKALSKAAELDLALEVYGEVLNLHEESSLALKDAKQEKEPKVYGAELHEPQESLLDNDDEEEINLACMRASTMICMGSIYYKLGSRVEELQMYRDAKAVYRQALGENHVYVAGTRKNIGMVLAERGDYEGAMQQFSKAMKIYLEVNNGSEMNRDVASAISCMGNVRNRTGELNEALEQYMEALRIYKTLHLNSLKEGNSSPSVQETEAGALRDVTSTLKVIGMVHAKKGDLDTSMQFFQEAMTLLRSPGIETTTTGRETMASVLTRIASIHLKKGDLDQAMGHYREAYDLTVRNNRGTTNHPDVAGILHYIGGIYHKKADYDAAMACYQEAIRIYHATLGPGNPTVAGTLVMVGSIYYKRRNLDSAMMFYREALRLNRDAYGMHHPDVAPILKSIGTILTKKGEYQEAYDIFRDVLRIKCTVHGTDHPEVASAYKSLGNVHYKMGDLADAERQYRHALSIYRRSKGEDHADTIAAKTTIEHLRYWMREREQRQLEQRGTKSSPRHRGTAEEERSC